MDAEEGLILLLNAKLMWAECLEVSMNGSSVGFFCKLSLFVVFKMGRKRLLGDVSLHVRKD